MTGMLRIREEVLGRVESSMSVEFGVWRVELIAADAKSFQIPEDA